ncbi:MAG: hypothetical protein WKF61_12110 [Luteimonas sp.]
MSILLRAAASIALLSAVTAYAAEPLTTTHPCAAVIEASERLGCYDKAFAPVAEARGTAADMAAERDRALREFGLNKVQLRVREPERMRIVAPDRMEATVTRVSSRSTGERIVTLDTGQVWLLTEVTMKGQLRSGDRVTIRQAALGTFMLLTPKGTALRAKRIQ